MGTTLLKAQRQRTVIYITAARVERSSQNVELENKLCSKVPISRSITAAALSPVMPIKLNTWCKFQIFPPFSIQRPQKLGHTRLWIPMPVGLP